MTAVGVEGDGVTFRMTRWHLRITTPYYVMRDPVLRHAGPTLRHTRPRSGIQVSVANAFGFYGVRCSSKPAGYGSPIELGMTRWSLRMTGWRLG